MNLIDRAMHQMEIKWIVELDSGCWLAPWGGDPGRTLVRHSAQEYKSKSAANRALEATKKRFIFRDFSRSRVVSTEQKLTMEE